MDAVSIIVALALAFLVGVFIARPLLIRGYRSLSADPPAHALTLEREMNLLALRELDFDHLTGKIADEDYAAQRAALVAQGVALLQQLETLTETQPLSAEAQLEAEVSAARAAGLAQARPATPPPVPGGYCPQCGTPRQAADRFCAKCGAALMRAV
jgi:hypothetical protein